MDDQQKPQMLSWNSDEGQLLGSREANLLHEFQTNGALPTDDVDRPA